MNMLGQLHAAGQRLWLDNITRDLISSGTLARYIDDLFVTGVTSNPTILERAISTSTAYDDTIAAAHLDAATIEDLVYTIAIQDLVAAADLLRPVFETSDGTDGFVSLEVPPALVDDADGTVTAGRVLFARADRPNIMIKVPGTMAGLDAVEQLIADGIPVNVTLLFSAAHYEAAGDAYQRGLERRRSEGLPVDVASVASVFVSRWDVAADPQLPQELRGCTALAVMQQVFERHHQLLERDRWKALAGSGAQPQKVLWASTGTKDPDLADTYYVSRLAAPGTVNTIPEPTLLAVADHGTVEGELTSDATEATRILARIGGFLDLDSLAATLQMAGAAAFQVSWDELLGCTQNAVDAVLASMGTP